MFRPIPDLWRVRLRAPPGQTNRLDDLANATGLWDARHAGEFSWDHVRVEPRRPVQALK